MLAGACVVVGLVLLFLLRHKTSLTGCGSRKVMEAVGLVEPVVDPELEKSTIFGDLPPEELDEIFPNRKKEKEANEAEPAETEEPTGTGEEPEAPQEDAAPQPAENEDQEAPAQPEPKE